MLGMDRFVALTFGLLPLRGNYLPKPYFRSARRRLVDAKPTSIRRGDTRENQHGEQVGYFDPSIQGWSRVPSEVPRTIRARTRNSLTTERLTAATGTSPAKSGGAEK